MNKEIDEKGKIVVLMWGGLRVLRSRVVLRKNRLFAVDIENHQQKKVVGILHRLGSGVVTFVIATSRVCFVASPAYLRPFP